MNSNDNTDIGIACLTEMIVISPSGTYNEVEINFHVICETDSGCKLTDASITSPLKE